MECLLFLVAFQWSTVVADALSDFPLDNLKQKPTKFVCPDSEVTDSEGVISSPFYPSSYPSHLSCSWHLQGQVGDVITIKFLDLDIEGSTCTDKPCCLYNWLKIGPLLNGSEAKICGKDGTYHHTFMSASNKLTVKFQISRYYHGGRGFSFRYKIAHQTSGDCKGNEFMCGNKKCIPSTLRCNGGVECEDGSDEMHCSNRCNSGRSCQSVFQCYEAEKHCNGVVDCTDFTDESDCSFCLPNQTWCGINSTRCYNPIMQRCDRIFDCLNGADEMDCYSVCPGKLMCDSRGGCYTIKERCNGITQCEDASDEKRCVPELCNYLRGAFLCDNKRCIQQAWTCDHTDDCGDGSDEKNCLRNSVLTAALMGSLICALLLVIAISCTCRLHALRMAEGRMQSRETPLSRMMSQEFLFREPPPPYAVAVQGDPPCRNQYCSRSRSGRPSRPRANRSSRRPAPRIRVPPVVPPNELLDDTTVICAAITEQSRVRQLAKTENDADSARNPLNSIKISRIDPQSNPCFRTGTNLNTVVNNDISACNSARDLNPQSTRAAGQEPCPQSSSDIIEATSPISSPDSSSKDTDCSLMVIDKADDTEVQQSHFCCDSDTDPLVA